MEMEELMIMNDVVEGWQEMEGNEKVIWVVGKACENGAHGHRLRVSGEDGSPE